MYKKNVAGYVAYKCHSKFHCKDCKDKLVRKDQNLAVNDDLLIFFKAYRVFGNESDLGNLCVPQEHFHKVISTAIDVFDSIFKDVYHLYGVGEILVENMTKYINELHPNFLSIEGICKTHRKFIISHLVKTLIFSNVRWINADYRDKKIESKKKRKEMACGNKNDNCNLKRRKLEHR